jgi:acyl carrier protein
LPTLIRQANDVSQESLLGIATQLGVPGATHPRPLLATEYVAPNNEVEQAIADIWQRALGIERVGVHDNFFDLGGDSVLGIQVIAATNRTLNAKLQPVKLFETPTVRAIAGTLLGTPAEEKAPSFENRRTRGERRRAKRQRHGPTTG